MNRLRVAVWLRSSAHPPKVPSPISRSAFQTLPFLLLPGGRLLTAAPAARFFDVELACMKAQADAALALGFGGGTSADDPAGSRAGAAGGIAATGNHGVWAIWSATEWGTVGRHER